MEKIIDKNIKIMEENKAIVALMVFPIAIIAKLIEHLILPDKYFYDSERMLNTMLDANYHGAWGGNYQVTVDFFNKINIFNFTTLLQWSVVIGLVFTIIFLIIIINTSGYDFMQSVFILMCIGLCNIYVFNLGKDIIQLGFFMACFLVIVIKYIPYWLKMLFCAGVFYWESTFFRNYYVIMAAFTIVVGCIFTYVRRKKTKISVMKIVMIVGSLFLAMFIFLNIAKILMPNEYMDIIVCKEDAVQLGASTTIDDKIIHGDNTFLFMQNYMINFVRMLFPIELLSGGVFYAPFLLFQILLFYYMYKNVKNIYYISDGRVLALSVYIAFFMGSVLFEPDFGSFARHEAAAFPIIIILVMNDNRNIEKNNKKERVVIYE